MTSGPSQPPSVMLASAVAALPSGFEPVAIRFAESASRPAIVTAREARQGEARGRPKLLMAYIDPATGRALAVTDFRDGMFGFLHRFHENLTIPEYSGRAVVGWTGVAMLILSLSGIYLWWPRNIGFRRALRYRRGPAASFNLHNLAGFWISIPLAVVSATGIYLGFPQQGRDLIASVAPMTPPQRGGFNAPLLPSPQLGPDKALKLALDGAPGATAIALFSVTAGWSLARATERG